MCKLGSVMMRGPRTLNILEESRRSRMEDSELGVSYDAVGCVSRRVTSPVPLVPPINRMEQGLDSGVE